LAAKLLLGESQVDLGFTGFWTKQEFGDKICDKKGSQVGAGEPVQPASRLGSHRLKPGKVNTSSQSKGIKL
jgi:hypothetical protein